MERATLTTQEDLSDRFKYFRYGIETELRMRTRPVKYALRAEVREYDYEEVPVLSSLDYTYHLLGGELSYDLLERTLIKASADWHVRDYKNRPARDLEGSQTDALGGDHPNLEYNYYRWGLTLRQTVGQDLKVYLDYDRLERDDEFVGYNDYTRDRYRIRVRYKDAEKRLLRVKLAYWERDYPRAFIFDRPDIDSQPLPRKFYEVWETELRGEVPLLSQLQLWAEYLYIDQNTTDPRYDYRRHQIMAGVMLEL